nr:immunoglobulin light chain junction region [Macaca mulatta]MOX23815.1 immunoglobulin light chain junction region [Macaca mulatta]MOX24126.1 immunoglobulin light chain junction region [Macaca mulatta]MOX24251.1 immunoglobulin light chain junction region [Macaca mulatta]MOX24321.1 immunoglobulin light chain junction region [Macaca mulatta]
CLQGYTTPLTF